MNWIVELSTCFIQNIFMDNFLNVHTYYFHKQKTTNRRIVLPTSSLVSLQWSSKCTFQFFYICATSCVHVTTEGLIDRFSFFIQGDFIKICPYPKPYFTRRAKVPDLLDKAYISWLVSINLTWRTHHCSHNFQYSVVTHWTGLSVQEFKQKPNLFLYIRIQ